MSEMDEIREWADRTQTNTQALNVAGEHVAGLAQRTNHVEFALNDLRTLFTRLLLGVVTAVIALGLVLSVLIFNLSQTSKQQADQQARIAVAIQRNNQRWCPVVTPLAPRPDDPPPVGTKDQIARSLRIRAAFADLVREYDCPKP